MNVIVCLRQKEWKADLNANIISFLAHTYCPNNQAVCLSLKTKFCNFGANLTIFKKLMRRININGQKIFEKNVVEF